MLASLLLLAASVCQLVIAADISGRVTLDAFPDHAVPIGSKVILDHGDRSALIRQDGAFTIYDVTVGEHVLEPLIPGYFTPLTLYTISDSNTHAQVYIPFRAPLPTTVPSLPVPITLTPKAEEYYTPAQSVNILGLLKSPMVLMMLFSGVMMYALPKLTESLDPEMAKEMAETRQKMQEMQNMDFMSGLSSMLAGETREEKPAVQAVAPKAGSGGGQRRGKGR